MSNDSLVLPCPHCGTLNRVPRARLGDGPRCADCKTHLVGGDPVDVDAATLARLIERSGLPVVVDFWASWCGPCRMMSPWFAEASRALADTAVLVKLNTEQNAEFAGRLGIQSIPTMVAFSGGRETARTSGAMQAAAIQQWVRQAVG